MEIYNLAYLPNLFNLTEAFAGK